MAGKRDKKDKTREKWRKGRNKNIIRYEKKGMGHGTKNKTRSQKCFNKNGQYIIYIVRFYPSIRKRQQLRRMRF